MRRRRRWRSRLESVPVEIDDLERRATSLEIERNALKREDDANSRERLEEVERELAEVQEQAAGLRARWQKEKGAIGEIAALKERLEQMRFEANEATRKGDLQRAAELQYGEIPKAERELAELTATQDASAAADAKLHRAGARIAAAEGGGRRGGYCADRVASGRGFLCRRCWRARCRS